MNDLNTLLQNMSPDTLALNADLVTQAQPKPAGNKYHAQKEEVDGHMFDSKKEAKRYRKLIQLEQAGQISDLELQPVFELQPAFVDAAGESHLAITYRADFQYTENDQVIIEDTKGMETAVFKLKKKLFLYRYQVELRIT